MHEDDNQKLVIEYACKSDIGAVRTENQDSYGKFPADGLDLYSEKGQLFIIADGVGGHADGKEASITAVEAIGKVFSSTEPSDKAEFLQNAIEEANRRIYSKSSASSEILKMATTCSVLLLKGNTAAIGHVGDSRIYKIENNHIERLTNDHTQVQEMLDKGLLSGKEAENYPAKSVLLRAVGIEEKIKVDVIENIRLKAHQHFVLCTDGLGHVTEDELLKIVPKFSPQNACEKLISLALERGGKDNITVLIIKVTAENNRISERSHSSEKTLSMDTAPALDLTVSNNTSAVKGPSSGSIRIINRIFLVVTVILLVFLGIALRSCL